MALVGELWLADCTEHGAEFAYIGNTMTHSMTHNDLRVCLLIFTIILWCNKSEMSFASCARHMWQPGFPIFMNLCFRNPWSQICDTCGRWVILSPHRSINTKSQYSQDFRANYADLGCEISYSGDKKRKMLRCVFLMAKCEIGRLVPVQMKLWSETLSQHFLSEILWVWWRHKKKLKH